jgi:hypothetical protein
LRRQDAPRGARNAQGAGPAQKIGGDSAALTIRLQPPELQSSRGQRAFVERRGRDSKTAAPRQENSQ